MTGVTVDGVSMGVAITLAAEFVITLTLAVISVWRKK